MTTLIVAEHNNKELHSGFGNALAAAAALPGQPIEALVLGFECRGVAEEVARAPNVSKVLLCDNPVLQSRLAENCAPIIAEAAKDKSHVIAAAGTFARSILPRAAALLDTQMITDVISIKSEDTFIRPIYAGNAHAQVRSKDAIKIMSIRTTAFEAITGDNSEPATIEEVSCGEDSGLSSHLESRVSKLERPELTSAKIVVSGGRGLGAAENFKLLESLADKLGAAIGASRAAVDAGYAPNDFQVGQTGKIVAPDLYIAVGISGAIQHIAGMKDSKVIVAINSDPDAPIFDIADYGLVGDMNEVLPQLEKAI